MLKIVYRHLIPFPLYTARQLYIIPLVLTSFTARFTYALIRETQNQSGSAIIHIQTHISEGRTPNSNSNTHMKSKLEILFRIVIYAAIKYLQSYHLLVVLLWSSVMTDTDGECTHLRAYTRRAYIEYMSFKVLKCWK